MKKNLAKCNRIKLNNCALYAEEREIQKSIADAVIYYLPLSGSASVLLRPRPSTSDINFRQKKSCSNDQLK